MQAEFFELAGPRRFCSICKIAAANLPLILAEMPVLPPLQGAFRASGQYPSFRAGQKSKVSSLISKKFSTIFSVKNR